MLDSATNVTPRTHVIGQTKGRVIRTINDERGYFCFVETEVGSVFLHGSVVQGFDPDQVILAGDQVEVQYESNGLDKQGNLKRRATKLVSFTEGDLLEGEVLRVHPKGFAFILADSKHGLDKTVFVPPKLVKEYALTFGMRVEFLCVEVERGLTCRYLVPAGERPKRVLFERDVSDMPFLEPKKGTSARKRHRNPDRSEKDRQLRLAMRGPGSDGQKKRK